MKMQLTPYFDWTSITDLTINSAYDAMQEIVQQYVWPNIPDKDERRMSEILDIIDNH